MSAERQKLEAQPDGICWLSDEAYEKAVGQFRLQVAAVFTPFSLYGLHVHIPGAIKEVVKLAEDFGLRVRGVDKQISIDLVRAKESHTILARS